MKKNATLREYLEENLMVSSKDLMLASELFLLKAEESSQSGMREEAAVLGETALIAMNVEVDYQPDEKFALGPLDISVTNKKITRSVRTFYELQGFHVVQEVPHTVKSPFGKYEYFCYFFQRDQDQGRDLQVSITRCPRPSSMELMISTQYRKRR